MRVYAAALFVSSALLFMVQPMAARRLLPVLGGTPAVWTASLLFFQGALLAGYAYAHVLSGRLALRGQAWVHGVVVAAAFAVLFVSPPPAPSDPGASPVLWLLASLAVDVGLPFFSLSASASLFQRWFSRKGGGDPYPLYAASNLGSLAGLFAYPLLIEPLLSAGLQRSLWTGGYGAFLILAASCFPRGAKSEVPLPAFRADRLSLLRWTALAALPAGLLSGVTQHLTTDLSPFPLLWVLPLALYLLSYVLAFSPRFRTRRPGALLLQSGCLIPLALLLPWETDLPGLVLPLALPLHLIAFFASALVCHGELADRRPPPEGLTVFYLCAAAGGTLGGAFNALAAPLLFKAPIEYPLLLVAACLLRPRSGPTSLTPVGILRLPGSLLLMLGLTLLVRWLLSERADDGVFAILVGGSAAALVPLLHGGPFRLAAGMAALLALGAGGRDRGFAVLHRDRSFFGAHRVEESTGGRRHLVHGSILHGAQDPGGARRLPLAYYHRQGPCGRLFLDFASRIPGGRVGAVGLGAGALAAYGLPGQRWTFFEVDPSIERTARGYFTYLEDSPAEIGVVLADGRIGLERSSPGEFGLIVMDAFSSDAVPLHLLTREGLELVVSRLAPGGVVAFHVSNRFLDLPRLLGGHAARAGWAGLLADEGPLTEEAEAAGRSRSTWVLLARGPEDLAPFARDAMWNPLPADPAAPAWTDSHSSILPLLKRPALR